jgi:hypothetical protein
MEKNRFIFQSTQFLKYSKELSKELEAAHLHNDSLSLNIIQRNLSMLWH